MNCAVSLDTSVYPLRDTVNNKCCWTSIIEGNLIVLCVSMMEIQIEIGEVDLGVNFAAQAAR